MQSYEEAPPPYPGTAPNVVTSKGDYKGVPVYEIGSNDAPVCKFFQHYFFLKFNIKLTFKIVNRFISKYQ
jgi:hypothetical protein